MSAEPSLTLRASGPDFRLAEHREALQHYLSSQTEAKACLARVSEDGTAIVTLTGSSAPRTSQSLAQKHHNLKGHTLYFSPTLSYDRAPDKSRPRHGAGLGRGRGRGAVRVKGDWRGEKIFPLGRGAARKETENGFILTHRGSTSTTSGGYSSLSDFVPDTHWSESPSYHSLPCLGFADGNAEREIDFPSNVDTDGCADTSLSLDTSFLHGPPYPSETCVRVFGLPSNADPVKVEAMVKKEASQGKSAGVTVKFISSEKSDDDSLTARLQLSDAKGVFTLWKKRHVPKMTYEDKPITFDVEYEESYEEDRFLIDNVPRDGLCLDATRAALKMHLESVDVLNDKSILGLCFVDSERNGVVAFLDDFVVDDDLVKELNSNGQHFERKDDEFVQLQFSLIPKPRTVMVTASGIGNTINKGMIRNYFHNQLASLSGSPLFVEEISTNEADKAIVKLRRISDAEAVLKISELPLISNSRVTIVQHSYLPTSFTAADLPSEAHVPEPEISDFEIVFSSPRINKHIIDFILSDPNTRWYRSLQQVGLFKWDPDTETIAFTCSSASVNVSESEWKSSTENKFDDLYFQFSIQRLEISEDEDLWKKTLTMAENENKLRGDPIRLIPRPQENTIRFVGEKHIAEDIHMRCASELSAWVHEKRKNEEEITETLRCPTDDHLTLLKSTPQYKSLEDSLGVKDDATPGHITITGPAYLVHGGKESMKDVLDSMREKSLSKRYSHLTGFFLSDVGFSQLSNALLEARVPAVVLRHRDDDYEDVERRSVRVLTFAEDFDTVTRLIANTFQTRHIRRRDEATSRYLRSSEASEFLKQLCSELSVVSSFADDEIVLTGPIGSVSKAHDDYCQFLLDNVIYERKCKVRGNYAFQYLKKFCQKRIDSIVSRLKSHSAEISLRRSGKRHYVVRRVTRNGREAVDAEIMKLLRTLHYAQDEFKKHGLDKYLKTDGFQQTKQFIEGKNDVMLFFGDEWEDDGEEEEEWEDEEGGEVEEEETLPFDSSSVSLGSFVRNKGSHSLTIGLFKGDLCKHRVDSIVNAANEDLHHIGGLAAHILECAGHGIQAESKDIVSTMPGRRLPTGKAVATSSGRLTTTKHIIHAVGPRWPYGKSRLSEEVAVTRNLLRDAVCSCLEVASGLKLKSIAFPAISSGIFSCPSDVVAENMVKGVDAFFAANPTSSVRRVDFIMRSSDEDNIRCFGDELKRKFGPPPPVYRPYRPKPAIRSSKVAEKFSSEVVPVRERASVRSKQFEVVVRSGDITAEKVDAIVNSTNKGLDLDSGQASKAISRAAGPGLQRECSQIVGNKGSLKPGYVYVTSGCNLPSSHVFHLLCPKSSKDLPAAVIRCLKKADKRNLSSIAFPALGTGNLGIADDKAADALFSGIEKFRTGNPKSSVKSVSVVIFDKTKLQAFQTMRRKYFVSESTESSAALDRFVQSASSPMEDPPTTTTTTDEATLSNGCRIKIEMGNVVADTTDAIVASQGVVLSSVLQADLTLQQSWKTKSGGKLHSDVVELPATQLNCQSVYVIRPTSYNNDMSDAANAQNISSVVEKCLAMADAAGFSSISIPTIGTGKLGYSNSLSCNAILDAAKAFASQHAYPSLSLIKISVFDAPRVSDFEKELQRQFPTASKPGVFRRAWGSVKSAFGYVADKAAAAVPTLKARKKVANYSAKEPDSVSVMIVGDSDAACGTALASLKRAIFENCTKRQFEGELPKELDAKILEKIAAERGVALSTQAVGEKTCIFLEGQVNDVHEGLIQLGTVLSEMIKQEHEEFETEAICSKVTWTWEDDKNAPVAYGRKDIRKIEEAFQHKETSVKLKLGGTDYLLDLKAMQQVSMSTQKVRKIDRQLIETIGSKNFTASAVPASWTCQTVSDPVKRIPLGPQSAEFRQVSQAFSSTLGGKLTNVVCIERVENVALYQKYIHERETLAEKRKAEIAKDSVEQIIAHGFNRSFAGKAAGRAFGGGVYFAHSSSTSHHYTKVNGTGNRTMFYCYVLMGLTIVGTPTMVEPPLIQASSSKVDRYDSTVNSTSNPTIFVSCYRDNMAYPAYIITFK
ncbi:protein mono-ADP-ribosyltransferase PARP14-like isoform X2 [Oscarella lobularis]|uniref:protein mono-ADP-ribosyltransferase PARP14-like isoform X2 n=1 Tax=Oscarella lobularis TaxID=121494 RepID=UPI003313F2F9